MSQRNVGGVLVALAGLTILYNVAQAAYNRADIEANPVFHLLTLGSTIKGAYTFTPPFTGFEILVLAVLVIGGFLEYTDES